MPSELPADLSNFDLTHLESMFDKQPNHSMDIEEDVASWLDSLSANHHSNMEKTNQSSGKMQLNHELNGNSIGDLMPRGDPLMGSSNAFNISHPMIQTNHDFDL